MTMAIGGASLFVFLYLIIGVIVALILRVSWIDFTDVVEFAQDTLCWPSRIRGNVAN